MNAIVLLLLGAGGVAGSIFFFVTKVFKGLASWGDELGGWVLFTGRRPTARGVARLAYRTVLTIIGVVATVYLSHRYPAIGTVITTILYGMWRARLGLLGLTIYGLAAFVWRRVTRFMGVEEWSLLGLHRARENAVVRVETVKAITSEMQSRIPVRVRAMTRATTSALGADPLEFGWDMVVETPDGTAAEDVARLCGNGLGTEMGDVLAAQITRNIRTSESRHARRLRRRRYDPDQWANRCRPGRDGRYLLPTIIGTASAHRPWNGVMDPSIATITVRFFDPFLVPVDYPTAVGVAPIERIEEPIPVGVERDGQVLRLSVDERNWLITGIRGGGKSKFLRPVMIGLFYCRYVSLILIDLKGGAELGPARNRASLIVTTPDEAAIVYRWAARVARQRCAEWELCPVTKATPAFVIIADEIQRMGEADITDDMTDQQIASAERHAARRMGVIAPALKLGRAARIIHFITTQYSRSDILSPHISSQCDRVSARMKTRAQAEVAMGDLPSKAVGPHRIQGDDASRGVVCGEFAGGPMRFGRAWLAVSSVLAAHALATRYFAWELRTNPDLVELINEIEAHRQGVTTAADVLAGAELDPSTVRRDKHGAVTIDDLPVDVTATIEECFRAHKPRPFHLPAARNPRYSTIITALQHARDDADDQLETRIVAALVTLGEPVTEDEKEEVTV